jgi:hypothetical protein
MATTNENTEATTAEAVVEIHQIHFDANGVGVGIISKDHLEDGAFEMPSEFVSMMAARYWLVDGVVTDAYEGKTDEEVVAILIQEEKDRAAALVAAKGALPKIITKLAFMDLFTEEELETIYDGAKTVTSLQVYLDKLKVADNIDLNDLRTQAGLRKLEAAGVLTDDRVLAILANQRPV